MQSSNVIWMSGLDTIGHDRAYVSGDPEGPSSRLIPAAALRAALRTSTDPQTPIKSLTRPDNPLKSLAPKNVPRWDVFGSDRQHPPIHRLQIACGPRKHPAFGHQDVHLRLEVGIVLGGGPDRKDQVPRINRRDPPRRRPARD